MYRIIKIVDNVTFYLDERNGWTKEESKAKKVKGINLTLSIVKSFQKFYSKDVSYEKIEE